METRLIVYAVFSAVYLGLIAGRIPRLAADRTGIVLLGAITLAVTGFADPAEGGLGVDIPTILLLFSFMIISAQLRLGGFYSLVSRKIAALEMSSGSFLAVLIGTSAGLSALLSNDIVCLAMTPVLIQGCVRKGRDPVPYLLALACSANIGSAATLIGNPQVMLIGQSLSLGFARYTIFAVVPVILSLALCWLIISRDLAYTSPDMITLSLPEDQPFIPWQTKKGLAVLAVVVGFFVLTPLPRDMVALAGAAVLLTSRTMASRKTLGLVNWQLLVLFIGLFIINRSFSDAGGMEAIGAMLSRLGISLRSSGWLFGVCAVLSNLVSNVPAVMLQLSLAPDPSSGPLLAIVSTFAGNLLVVGSIANIIVLDQAAASGVKISWERHARTGIPVTLASLAVAAVWLAAFPW